MQYAVKVNCKSEFFRGLLLLPMLCMMECRVSLLESSILLNALSSLGEKSFHREAVCKFAVCKIYSEPVSSPPKRESCLEKCKSLNCGRACMCGLLVELNINSSVHTSRGHYIQVIFQHNNLSQQKTFTDKVFI